MVLQRSKNVQTPERAKARAPAGFRRQLGFDAGRALFQPRCMNAELNRVLSPNAISKRIVVSIIVLNTAFGCVLPVLHGAQSIAEPAWRSLPLITDGKVDPNWIHLGWGGFVVDDGALRTDCDPKGLGLLVYKKERLGNCQVRVVFKSKEAKSNSGVYVRIADGILKQAGQPGAAFERDANGKPSNESMEKMKASAAREEGPWFAVHRGYEVQIADGGDPFHRTGAIYSLAPSSAVSMNAGEWRTLIITLAGDQIFVDLDGQRITRFDARTLDTPPQKQWHEPKREPKRPQAGYLGLQNHDPGDIVWFKEVSVRPLPSASAK
jgi:hypothetical protein